MNFIGSGFITIILYGLGDVGSGQFNLLTEAQDPILTEANDNIVIEN